MDKAIDALLKVIGDNPWLIALFVILMICIHYGPSYITAISNARSQKRRDNAELSEKEAEIRERIRIIRMKEKDNA